MGELRAGDPRRVGGYALLARLGSGGMGEVYLGRSLSGRHVAVKVIRADLAQDPGFRARFAREVAAARRVSGAFTAPVIDADPDAPVPWLVTDYVPGPSLGDAVARHGALPPAVVLILAARLAEGLVAVHAAGVIHRDLKPANVLLAQDGPRLIDFGISQAADFAQVTSPTSVLGTPGFIAPELVQGGPVGPASDVFTMGAVLAYAATGEYPFGTGPADARTLRVLYLTPDLDKVPAGLRPLVERCLAKDPAGRPTAAGFLADLVAACPGAADDRDDWLPAGILAEIRQRPLPQAPPAAEPRHDARVSPGRAMTVLPGERTAWPGTGSRQARGGDAGFPPAGPATRPAGGLRRRAWVAGLTAALAAIGAATIGLVALSGHPPTQATPSVAVSPAAVPRAALSPSGSLGAAEAGLGWDGTVDLKEVASSDSYFEKVGATWTEYWTILTDCALQPCGATLTGRAGDGSDQFTAALSRDGLTYAGDVAIDDYWTCAGDNKPMNSTLYITLTGKSTATPEGPEVSSFTGVLKWVVPAQGECLATAEYDMQVHNA